MKEKGGESQIPAIISEWTTKEINPWKIAEALGGVLKRTTNNDSRLEIDFNYGGPNPLLTLTCDPENRTMSLHVNAPSERANKACGLGFNLYDICNLHFVRCRPTVPGITKTDMTINVRDSGSDLNTTGMITISSHFSHPTILGF